MEICKLEHIHKDYHMGEVVTPLKDVSLTVNAGDFIAVEGPSGIGKSTLLYVLGTLLQSDKGSYTFGGEDVAKWGDARKSEFRATKIGFLFQDSTMIQALTLRENLLLTRPELPYIATNPDLVCPTEFGSVPDCGSVCYGIKNATGKEPIVIGKPSTLMPQLAMERLGIAKEQTCVVGDRIYTDVKSGLNAGITDILVLSGETTLKILEESEDKPHLVLQDAGEILAALKE